MLRETTNLRLRDARAKKGLSQEGLARRARVALNTVNQAETGKRVPTVMTQERIAKALGLARKDIWPDQLPPEQEAV